jgi:hypothetical protein
MQSMATRVALATRLTLPEAAAAVRSTLANLHARVEDILTTSAAQGQVDGLADIALIGRREAILNTWAVQVFFYDLGVTCGVELVALGEASPLRALLGTGNTASLTKSVHRMDALVAELRARDPHTQLIA